MAGLLVLKPGVGWTATGGLLDWTIEFLAARITDDAAVTSMREVVDNNLGALWINEFSRQTQHDIVTHLRSGLIPAAQQELPDTDYKTEAIQHLQELVDLTQQLDSHG